MSRLSKEQKMCPVLGIVWETGVELIAKDGEKLERTVITGYAFDPSVQDIIDKGNVVLVVIDKDKTEAENPACPKEYEAKRTGDYLYLDTVVAFGLFGKEMFSEKSMAYIEQDTYDTLVKGANKVDERKEDEENFKLD